MTLCWAWKEEPVSPPPSEESDDAALYSTPDDCPKQEIEFSDCDSKAAVASKLLEGLEQLEDLDQFIKDDLDQWIKDEPFSNWLEEKMLPMFDEHVEASSAAVVKLEQQRALLHAPDTQSLLQEFENVFALTKVEMTHGTLTPPQSPPYQPLLTTLEPVQSVFQTAVPAVEKALSNFYGYQFAAALPQQVPIQSNQDVVRELAVVDEIIRSRAEDMIQCPSSPCSSSSSGSSNFGDCSSDDPEWIPEPVDGSEGSETLGKAAGGGRKRTKPYSRAPPEEKKSRKKEQNKNAATRYRMKKKAEVEEILEEERLLSKSNDSLEGKISDVQREIKYLKGLMRDLFKAKGLIN